MKQLHIHRGRELLAAGAAAMLLFVPASAQEIRRTPQSRVAVALPPAQWLPRLTSEKKGDLPTRDALRLRVVTDVGNIRVLTRNSGHVSYLVRIETDASQPDARQLVERFELVPREDADGVVLIGRVPSTEARDRLWVSFEVNVPRHYSLDVRTEAGNVSSEDIGGQVTVYTGGGDITLGHIGGSSKLDTQGGHIRVQDVNGNLVATTVGGHIIAGQVQGDATLRSGGGHVRVDYVGGKAQLESGGGSISILKTTAGVTAVTAGGRIDVGEAYGAIRARTGGGPIRVARVVGPTQFEASGGSIYLTRVEGPVRASTTSGTITAWITPEGKMQGGSQLICGQGDIVVYLPKELAVTIQATIDSALNHTILADPGVPLKISTEGNTPGQRTIRAEGNLNGGGQILQLKTKAGNIRLRFSDAFQALNQQLYMAQLDATRRRIEMQQQIQMETQARILRDEVERAQKLAEAQKYYAQGRAEPERSRGFLEELQSRLREAWYGQVRVNSKEQDAKRLNNVLPLYPEAAKRAGIQGIVQLVITIGKDGKVTNTRLLSGHPMLAEAAIDAVRQWRYSPTVSNGKPVAVVTLVAVEFRLD
jgi:TonB family protein